MGKAPDSVEIQRFYIQRHIDNYYEKYGSGNKKSLPESHSIPAEDFVMPRGAAANTAEMVQPLSVTEETTNLLNK